jgi:hypothetical protein
MLAVVIGYSQKLKKLVIADIFLGKGFISTSLVNRMNYILPKIEHRN